MSVWNFAWPYKKFIFLAWSLMLVELVVEILAPIWMAKIIDEGILTQDLQAVIFWGGVLLLMSLIAFGSGILNSFLAAHAAQSFGYDIRKEAYKKVQNLPYSSLNELSTPSLITRLTNDVVQIQNMLFMTLRIALRAPLLVIFGTVAAFLLDAKLALIYGIIVPILVLFLIWVLKKAALMFQRVQKKLDGLNGIMRQTLAGIRVVKAFYNNVFENERFEKANKTLTVSLTRSLQFIELAAPLLLFLMYGSIIFIIWLASGSIPQGNAQPGEVVAIVNYGTRISHALAMLSWIIMAFSRAKASAERVQEILKFEEEKVDGEADLLNIQGDIEFSNVTFSYDNNTEVIANISFSIKPGERIAIMGATGSGKTSLVQLLPRLFEPTGGKIFLDGRLIEQYPIQQLRNVIGFVPQEAHLFTGTIKENIAWGKRNATMEEIVQAAKDAQIHETILRFPKGYETVIGQKGVNLSGGQKQRLSIARALVRKPKILILDDCTSALDLMTEGNLLEAIKRYNSTMILITQKVRIAERMDRILLLDDGMIVNFGTYDELISQSQLFQQLVESQQWEVEYDANAVQ